MRFGDRTSMAEFFKTMSTPLSTAYKLHWPWLTLTEGCTTHFLQMWVIECCVALCQWIPVRLQKSIFLWLFVTNFMSTLTKQWCIDKHMLKPSVVPSHPEHLLLFPHLVFPRHENEIYTGSLDQGHGYLFAETMGSLHFLPKTSWNNG